MADDTKMIKGSEVRKADHQIEPLLLDRWSPRAMSGKEISKEELMRLFQAARWAPSSFNLSRGAHFMHVAATKLLRGGSLTCSQFIKA
jgi:nitroreductase